MRRRRRGSTDLSTQRVEIAASTNGVIDGFGRIGDAEAFTVDLAEQSQTVGFISESEQEVGKSGLISPAYSIHGQRRGRLHQQ